ncbi:MAG: non-hydrolyzing UDP-N-acetylglucosamine 2-epimerase [Acidimicrobiales bacterium]
MRVVCVAAARPNFMKVKPVMDALEARGVEVTLVHTGQHYDPEMSDVFFSELGLRAPDCFLGVGSGSHAEQVARVMVAFEPLVERVRPDVVVVVGDVNSTLACALVAAKAGPLVAHVEAGLRSRDWSMPEEVNRVVTDRVSDYLLAPSPDAVDNLAAEGYRGDQVHLVGNTMVDTLLANLARSEGRRILAQLGLSGERYGVVTLHRPSNVDDPARLGSLVAALGKLAAELPLVFPAHPRTAARLADLRRPAGLRVVAPLGYLDFLALQAGARLVLTDSGGIQEETTVLGVACLTLRDNTERPLTITEGTNHLVGTDPHRILAEGLRLAREGCAPRRPALWDGHAGERIAEVLVSGGPAAGRLRPSALESARGPS